MLVLKGHDQSIVEDPTAVAIGTFDGVHLGHQHILNETCNYAKAKNLKPAILTMSQHPRLLVKGSAPPLLSDLDTKLKIFEEMGFAYVLLLDFTPELREMSPETYLQNFVVETLKAQYISIGYNHHFGKDRAGGPEFLKDWSKANGSELYVCEPVRAGSEVVSSSRIREYILEGDITKANLLLGRDFALRGRVVAGDARGKELGFPTANVKVNPELAVPANGVYAARVSLQGATQTSSTYQAAVNIGLRPTFKDENERLIEVHILDFDQNIYDQEIEISFLDYIRAEKKFSSKEELVEQIKKDIAGVKIVW